MSLGHSTLSEAPLGAIAGGIVASNVTEDATGFVVTQFGTPALAVVIAEASSVAPATAFGTATSVFVRDASSIAPTTAFGTPDGFQYSTASGFSSTVFSIPSLELRAESDPTSITYLPATIASSTFDSSAVTSDFGTHVWSISSGSIAGGTFGDQAGYGWGETELLGLGGIATSGYYTIAATVVSVARPFSYSSNALSIELRSTTDTLWMYHKRNGEVVDNDYTYIEYGATYPDSTSTQTPYPTGSTHTIQFNVTPTQTTTTVDGVVMFVAAVAHGITLLDSLYIGAQGLRIDSISILDAHADTEAGPYNHEVLFGTPTANSAQLATPITSTIFGTPATPVPQTVTATGLTIDGFGRPTSSVFFPPVINRAVSASALRPLVFGLTTTSTQVSEDATGNIATAFGTPTSRAGQAASALAPATTFGTPATQLATYAAGFAAAVLGTPNSVRVQPASAVYRATRWGTPDTVRPDTYPARSAYSLARFGRPSAMHLNAYGATSLAVTTHVSTPTCHQKYRAFHLYPDVRFGRPLKTGQTC